MNILHHFGEYMILLKAMFARPEKPSMYWKELMRQMVLIGVDSAVIITIISVFIGAVTGIQYAYQLSDSYVPNYFIGYVVRDSMIIEFAPTITCIVLAGKVGSNITAELGGMRINEQIDALEVMGINTAAYLVLPKLLAALFVIPLLVSISAFLGILGGYIATSFSGVMTSADFMQGLYVNYEPYNVFVMLVKAVVFGFLLTSISSYLGYTVKGGIVELGKASTQAVVMSNVTIVLADYIIALLMT